MTNNIIDNNISSLQEKQFAEVVELIIQHKCRASVAVNNETLFTAWSVGKYVSDKLKNEEWGSKVVSQLSEYIRAKRPDVKGFSRSSIYNRDIQLIPTLYFLKTAKYQIVLREKWSWRII